MATSASVYTERAQQLQDQRWKDQRDLQLTPLQASLRSDMQRLTNYVDANGNPLPQHKADYDLVHNRMANTIGQIRGLYHDNPQGPNPVEAALGNVADKLHITNHLKNHVAQARADAAARYAAQNQQMATETGVGALPFAQTPAGQAEIKKAADAQALEKQRSDSALAVARERENARATAETDYQKAQIDLRAKTLALQQAKFEASKDPNNPATRTALLRAREEQQRSQAYMIRAQAGAFGSYNGNPLPGAQVDSAGNPVGSMFAGNVKPTATEMGRADLATSAIEQIDTMKDLLTKRSDLFGPVAGRGTNFTQWIGSQDPDAQKFAAAARTAADHLAGVFGGHSQAALQQIYDIIGKNATNPKAAIAALNQVEVAARRIQARGTRHVVGGAPGTDVPSGPVHQKNQKAKKDSTDPLGVL